MKKCLIYILYICVTLGLTTSCVDNDGDIGSLFGLWSVEEIKIDGHPAPGFEAGETFFAFQTSIIQVTRRLDNMETETRTGTWIRKEGTLTLDFSHSDSTTSPSQGGYAPPGWIFITDPVTVMALDMKSDRMINLTNGRYSYTLVKI